MFDVELLRLSAKGLLLVAKNGKQQLSLPSQDAGDLFRCVSSILILGSAAAFVRPSSARAR